jgi:hypothetical protein
MNQGGTLFPYTPGIDLYRAYSIAAAKKEIIKLITRTAP